MYIPSNSAIMCLLMLIFTAIAQTINRHDAYTVSILVALAIGIYYSVKDIKSRFTMFSFNLGYFVFLLGGFILHWLTEGNFRYLANGSETVTHTLLCLEYSLVVFNLVSIIIREKKRIHEIHEMARNQEDEAEEEPVIDFSPSGIITQSIALLLMVSFLCELLVEYRTTSIIRATTYALSMSVSTGLPTIITSLASYYYVALFLFWALLPPKTETLISILSLGVIEGIILLSGERGEPISLALTVFFYILLRNRNHLHDIRISKGAVVAILIAVPFFIAAMQMLSYTRVNREYQADFQTSITDFFEAQGGSAKIIAKAYDLREPITKIGGHTYVSGTIRSYLSTNIFARLLLGKTKSKRTVADAYSGNSFLATYGYLVAANTYKKGVGGGSTYIAEVYQDGGYGFLILFNIFLALMMMKIDMYENRSVIGCAILLNIFRYMPLLPRGIALQWLTSTFAIQNLILFIALYFVMKQVGAGGGAHE